LIFDHRRSTIPCALFLSETLFCPLSGLNPSPLTRPAGMQAATTR
jgi:hypothetical protein